MLYGVNSTSSSSLTPVACIYNLPCTHLYENDQTYYIFFGHASNFNHWPFKGRPDIECGALYNLNILILLCILLRLQTRQNLDIYNDTKR